MNNYWMGIKVHISQRVKIPCKPHYTTSKSNSKNQAKIQHPLTVQREWEMRA